VRFRVDDPLAPPTGTVVLLHGFTRSPERLASLSSDCVALGARTVAPALGSLWWPTSTNNAAHLGDVIVAMESLVAQGPVVVVGHSAGAAAGAWIAAGLVERGIPVATLVMVDGVESPSHLIARSWDGLAGARVRAVCAPPSRCNRDGSLATWLADRGGAEVVVLPGLGHGDIEGPTTGIYRWACGDDPRQPAGEEARHLVRSWVREGLGRSGEGVTPGL
jgi:hypothetical protein